MPNFINIKANIVAKNDSYAMRVEYRVKEKEM